MVAPAPAPADAFELHTALQLLAQAGRELPVDAEPGSVQWMQALIDALCDLSSRDALTGLLTARREGPGKLGLVLAALGIAVIALALNSARA
jgi:hypothetical protein